MESNEMTIDLYGLAGKMVRGFLKTWKAALAVLLLAGTATSVFTGLTYRPIYESKTTFAVSREMNGEENYLYNKDATDELSVSFESILYSDIMQDAMCAELGAQTLPAQLVSSRVGTTNLFTVAAQGEEPKEVKKVIDAFLDNYARVFRSALMDIELEIIERPEDAVISSSPQYMKKEIYVCGGLAVLYVICLGMFALFHRTITEEEEVKEYLRTSCLGTLPYVKSVVKGKEPLITEDGSRYFEMKEAAGAIRRRLEKEHRDSGASVFLMTGASDNEGVSTTAANIALSLAYRGRKTALVDLNLRRPSLLKRFHTKKAGLRKGVIRFDETLMYRQKTSFSAILNLYGVDKPAEKAAEILAGAKLERVLKSLKARYEFVILDSPPLLNCSDTLLLAKKSDAAVFVLQEDKISTGSLIDAMEMLNETSVRILGCVINGSRTHVSRYGYGYGYGYHYRYRYGYGYGYGYGNYRYGYGKKKSGEKKKNPIQVKDNRRKPKEIEKKIHP